MFSQSVISDLQYYDVLCIGNYAAVAADYIASYHRDKYKIAVLHLGKNIKYPSSSSIGSEVIQVEKRLKGVDLIGRKVQLILPDSKTVILEDRQKLTYKFLVYGEGSHLDKKIIKTIY